MITPHDTAQSLADVRTISQCNLEEVACGVCGCTTYTHLFWARDYIYSNEGEWPIAKCSGCGVVFMNPRIPPADIGQFYPKTYYTNAPRIPKRFPWLKNAIQDEVLRHKYGYPMPSQLSGPKAPLVALGYVLLSNWASYARHE